jgi:hypothetical protein
MFHSKSMTMAAAGAIRRRHLPDGGIRYPVASIETQDVLHWVMRPALYRRICMAIEIVNDLPAFFVIAEYLFADKLS